MAVSKQRRGEEKGGACRPADWHRVVHLPSVGASAGSLPLRPRHPRPPVLSVRQSCPQCSLSLQLVGLCHQYECCPQRQREVLAQLVAPPNGKARPMTTPTRQPPPRSEWHRRRLARQIPHLPCWADAERAVTAVAALSPVWCHRHQPTYRLMLHWHARL